MWREVVAGGGFRKAASARPVRGPKVELCGVETKLKSQSLGGNFAARDGQQEETGLVDDSQ
jgi:hypothetical protein